MCDIFVIQEFLIGKPAAEILISYHALQHFKFLMHQKCQEEVSTSSCLVSHRAGLQCFDTVGWASGRTCGL